MEIKPVPATAPPAPPRKIEQRDEPPKKDPRQRRDEAPSDTVDDTPDSNIDTYA